MKLSLMFVLGVVVVLTERFCIANLQAISAVGLTEDNHGTATIFGGLSSEELKEIQNKAKDISHSKGPIKYDNRGDPEYRRSLIQKLRLKTNSLALRKVIAFFQNSTDDMIIPNLEALEFLVHEYHTAIDFMNIGGMDFLNEMIKLNDRSVASAALSVLSAAMQGNNAVQVIASKTHILDVLLANLASKDYLPGILYAISSYLRDMPDSQLRFCEHDGISSLVDIMKNYTNTLKFRMHAIEILADLSYEMFEDSYYSNLSSKNIQLIREFSRGIKSTGACKEITLLLQCNEYNATQDKYYIHEKIVDAMKDLIIVCRYQFQTGQVKKLIENLINLYHPHSMSPWYSSVDEQLQNEIYQDLTAFHKKIYKKTNGRKNVL